MESSYCGRTDMTPPRCGGHAIESYRLTEACKLQVLAELAAAKGRADLAEDIRQIARVLLGGAPLRQPSRLTAAAVFRAAAARSRGASPH